MSTSKLAANPTYAYDSHTVWAVETDTIVVMNTRTSQILRLAYPEAALWDLLSRGYSWERVCQLMAAIIRTTPEDAECLVETCLARWVAAELLIRSGGHG